MSAELARPKLGLPPHKWHGQDRSSGLHYSTSFLGGPALMRALGWCLALRDLHFPQLQARSALMPTSRWAHAELGATLRGAQSALMAPAPERLGD